MRECETGVVLVYCATRRAVEEVATCLGRSDASVGITTPGYPMKTGGWSMTGFARGAPHFGGNECVWNGDR